jgi:hypothetical protein
MGSQFNIRDMPERSAQQIADIAKWTGHTKTQIVLIAVENLWKEVKQERVKHMSMQEYGVDLSNLNEEQRSDASYELHALQQTCLDITDNVGRVYGTSSCVETLQEKGFDVKLAWQVQKSNW